MTEGFVYQHNKLGQSKGGNKFMVQENRFPQEPLKYVALTILPGHEGYMAEKTFFMDMVLYNP